MFFSNGVEFYQTRRNRRGLSLPTRILKNQKYSSAGIAQGRTVSFAVARLLPALITCRGVVFLKCSKQPSCSCRLLLPSGVHALSQNYRQVFQDWCVRWWLCFWRWWSFHTSRRSVSDDFGGSESLENVVDFYDHPSYYDRSGKILSPSKLTTIPSVVSFYHHGKLGTETLIKRPYDL